MGKVIKFIAKISFIVSSFFMVGCANDSSNNNETIDTKKEINIYALNDFHGAFLSSSSYTGLSKIGEYLINEKTNNPDGTIILSSGDMFQGTVESNLNKGALMTDAMNLIGFDSMTVGNHEFDWGEEILKANAQNMNFPLLACNIFYKGTKNRPDYLKPYAIVSKGEYKVGIIGAVQENIGTSILRSISNNFDYLYPVDYVKEYSDILFNDEKCDAVILSTHDGGEVTYSGLSSISSKSKKEYVNGIFLGHDHNVKNGDYDGVPYVEGGSSGSYISKITLKMSNKNNVKTCYEASGFLIKTSTQCQTESTAINALYDSKYKESIESIKNEVIGYAPKALSKNEIGSLVSEAMVKYVNLYQDEFNHSVNFGCVNGSGGIRKTLPKGNITYGDLVNSIPFDNFITVAKLNEDQFFTYRTYYKDTSYCTTGTIDEVKPYSDGFYYVATINYVSEQRDNTSVFASNVIYRDATVSMIKEGLIEAINKI